ncbi:hypothetical protein C0995_010984, partial [Termitomyces sp. Mi166
MAIPAPPPQFTVVVVTTDPRTPEQYDGLVATQQKAVAVSKGKGKIVPTLSDKSNYGESLSEHEWELEEGESAAQHFQRVQYNKKLAAKKVNKAKAEAALQHRAINDFSGHIPNRLGVKVWGPLDVEQLNLCFTGALSDCVYYSVHNNAIFIGADANWGQCQSGSGLQIQLTAAGQDACVSGIQKLDESLLNKTMRALLHDPMYRDLQSPIWGDKDKDFVVPRHILTHFMCVKEDGTIALHVMHALDPSQP